MIGAVGINDAITLLDLLQYSMMARNLWMIKDHCIIEVRPIVSLSPFKGMGRIWGKCFRRNTRTIVIGKSNECAMLVTDTKNVTIHQLLTKRLITTNMLPLIPETVEGFVRVWMWVDKEPDQYPSHIICAC